MNKNLLKAYEDYKSKKSAYDMALSTMYFDIATIAPKEGIPYRNKILGILSGEAFSFETNEENIKMINDLAKQDDIPDELKKELELALRDLDDIRVLPKEVYVAFTQIIADSQHAWEEAKEKNDYQIFKPHLINVIEKQKEVLTYVKKECSDYDYLLDRYEIGLNSEIYDVFFDKIKEELLPLIKRIRNEAKQIDDHVLFETFDIEKQKEFMDILMKYLQANPRTCYITTSEHPFTQFFSSKEARVTTHYHEDNLMSAISSTIHEYGHANYSLHVNPTYEGSPLTQNIGYAMHESQSRFMENHIGKHPSFWKPLYPKLQEVFPEQLSSIPFDDFIRMINVSRPSFIRTEADELTYPIHILIRYELEKEIFNGNIDYDALDTMWNDKYEEYLGIRPQSEREGILQDMHWGAANLGYFPTYALGSAYAAQFYHQMEKDLDVAHILEHGKFEEIYEWLAHHIHQYGAYKSADDIMKDTTAEKFNPDYYINYLKDKYTALYKLQD